MSLLYIITNKAPKIDVFELDAALEDNFQASVVLTDYPVESGVRVSDHRIIQPFRYSIVGAVSNNPLRTLPTDFIGGALSNVIGDSGIGAAVAGVSAAFLAGGDETRASSALEKMIDLMKAGDPFSVDAVDIQLANMVVVNITRTRDPENENGLIFIADLQELISLDRIPQLAQPQQSQLRDGDPAKTGVAAVVNKGQRIGQAINQTVSDAIANIRSAL